MSAKGGGAVAAALTVVGGLAVAGGAAGPWVSEVVTRAIEDAEVAETVVTRGVEFTRFALPAGLALAVGGIAVAALGPRPRRVVGAVIAVAGLAVLGDLGAGLVAAMGEDGILTAAPGIAMTGAAGAVVGALLAVRARRSAGLPPRFDLDADETDDADDEWRAAVDPEETDQ